MKCPKCEHESGAVLLRCSACGEAFKREAIERLTHLEYLLAWLDERAEKLGAELHVSIRTEASGELNAVLEGWGLTPSRPIPKAVEPEPLEKRPLEEIAHELGCLELILDYIHGEKGLRSWRDCRQFSQAYPTPGGQFQRATPRAKVPGDAPFKYRGA